MYYLGQSLINDEDRAALDKMTVEGDVSDSTLNVDVVKASVRPPYLFVVVVVVQLEILL